MDDTKLRAAFKNSFTACYLILYGTALITFIEAIRTNNVTVRHMLNLETAVSLTASFVYQMFVTMTDDKTKPLDLQEITFYRYIDWSITTPMLLLVFLLFITFHTYKPLHVSTVIMIFVLNYIMLRCGYHAEKYKAHKDTSSARNASILGFLAYFGMICVIYIYFLKGEKNLLSPHMIMFYAFTSIWAFYGVAAEMDVYNKNITYNILDVISKVLFGLALWCYYGGVLKRW